MEISLEALIAYLCIAGFIVLYILPKLTASRWIQRAKNGMLEEIDLPKRWKRELQNTDEFEGRILDYMTAMKNDMQGILDDQLREQGKLLLEALGEMLGNALMDGLSSERLKSIIMQSLGAIKGQFTQSATSGAVTEDLDDVSDALAQVFGPHIIEVLAEKHPALALAGQFGAQHPDMVRDILAAITDKSGRRMGKTGTKATKRNLY